MSPQRIASTLKFESEYMHLGTESVNLYHVPGKAENGLGPDRVPMHHREFSPDFFELLCWSYDTGSGDEKQCPSPGKDSEPCNSGAIFASPCPLGMGR